jgi:cell division protein FtsB
MSIKPVNRGIEFSKNLVRSLGEMYNFDSEEAIRKMNLDVKKEKKVKVKEIKEKSKYPLPFNNKKNENCCNGLRQNHGLYTQCESVKVKENEYCKKCQNECSKNSSGKPDYGCIEDRLQCGLYEFRDPKGKSPIAYTKLMSKLKFTREEVENEAKRLNYEIDPMHFEYTEEPKRGRPKSEKKEKDVNVASPGKKGRPKKMNKEIELISDVSEDIFASLVENANAIQVVNNVVVSEVPAVVVISEKSEKEAKKLEKDAKKAEKEAKKLEKEAKKLEKEAKKLEKEAKKLEKDAKKVEKVSKKPGDEQEVDIVRKFEYEGSTTYLKSKNTGVVYNMDQELVGKWNETTQKIDFEDIDDEEEEDEYDEE